MLIGNMHEWYMCNIDMDVIVHWGKIQIKIGSAFFPVVKS